MKNGILVIDVGGTHVKVLASGGTSPIKIPSGPGMTARNMVSRVRKAAAAWNYGGVSIGLPAAVVRGRILHEPVHLGKGWMRFDFRKAFGKPVKIVNDAAMQALGSYEGGTMLFLGLGTGLGSALIVDGVVAPLELAHLPYKKGEYEDYVGVCAIRRFGKRRWRRHVRDVVDLLRKALVADYVVLGGGNAKKLKKLPEAARLGANSNAFLGGQRLWQP